MVKKLPYYNNNYAMAFEKEKLKRYEGITKVMNINSLALTCQNNK